MFDSSAYELFDDVGADPHVPAPRHELEMTEAAEDGSHRLDSPVSVAVAACSLCTQTLGGCAINGAKAGVVSPAVALSVCNWMNRAAARALRRTGPTSTSGYLAYVLLGNGRSRVDRETDFQALAETMR